MKQLIKSKLKFIFDNGYYTVIFLAVVLNVFIEVVSRKNPIYIASYIVLSPLTFIYNSLIIAFTLSFVLLSKRRTLGFTVVSLIWLLLGISNGILLMFRVTPFTAVDFTMIESAILIMDNYMNLIQMILVFLFIAIFIGLSVYLSIKLAKKKTPVDYLKSLAFIVTMSLMMILSTKVGIATNLLETNFGNIANAYRDYGFPYCFSNSLINTGIYKPSEYSTEVIDEIIESVKPETVQNEEIEASLIDKDDSQNEDVPNESIESQEDLVLKPVNPVEEVVVEEDSNHEDKKPNIIVIQLESFFDPTYMKDLQFSKDPVPHFRELKAREVSGFLSVPSIGAGTANTEFEVITGMNLDFFGPGEYPYKTILQETTCESMAFNLKELGYKAHSMHNNDGTFYSRNIVFSQLGFDTFTSMEYMKNLEFTPLSWAKDKIIATQIIETLKTTQESDFIFAISVQGHGKYPEEVLIEDPQIIVEGELEEGRRNAIEYFVNQIYEMDQVIGKLVNELEKMDEEYVLVLYGDHLPSLDIVEEELSNADLFQTEYVIASNRLLNEVDKNLQAYQLSAYVMELLDFDNGVLTKFHRNYAMEEDYLSKLELLEYDMFYGELEVYGGISPYEPSSMQMGLYPIEIVRCDYINHRYVLRGHHFTPYSHVTINGKLMESRFINSSMLDLFDIELTDGDLIVVQQIGDDKEVLSETEAFVYDYQSNYQK